VQNTLSLVVRIDDELFGALFSLAQDLVRLLANVPRFNFRAG